MTSTPVTNRITLQQVKHAIVPGRGTARYEAVILFDGKPAFLASNDGRGEGDFYSPLPGHSHAEFGASMKEVTDWVSTLPPVQYPCGSIPRNIEIVIGEALETHLTLHSHRRDCRTKVVFTIPGRAGVFTVPKPKGGALTPSELREYYDLVRMNYPGAIILNDLPDQEVAAIIRREREGKLAKAKAA